MTNEDHKRPLACDARCPLLLSLALIGNDTVGLGVFPSAFDTVLVILTGGSVGGAEESGSSLGSKGGWSIVNVGRVIAAGLWRSSVVSVKTFCRRQGKQRSKSEVLPIRRWSMRR